MSALLHRLRGVALCAALVLGIVTGGAVASAHGAALDCSHDNPLTITEGDGGSGTGPTNLGISTAIVPSCTADVHVTLTLQDSAGQTVARAITPHAPLVAGQQSQQFVLLASFPDRAPDCYTPSITVAGAHGPPTTLALPLLTVCLTGA